MLRDLAHADLDDDGALTALLDERGVVMHPYFHPVNRPVRGRMAPRPRKHVDGWWEARHDGTLEDARAWLKTARALAGGWAAWATGEEFLAAWPANGFEPYPPEFESLHWSAFTIALNVGLRPFRAHAEHTYKPPGGDELAIGTPRIDLYQAACAQLFNLMVSGETLRRCEKCGQPFHHQLGGAKYRQHRSTGLRFCTPACARAEASRKYPSRKREGESAQ